MTEKEIAEEYFENECLHSYADTEEQLKEDVVPAFQKGAEFGYNKGYHEAEEHYLNVIDSQHKLVDESKKKDFRKCMKCTSGTYQSGFKDGYNKAKEEMIQNGLALQSDMDKTIEQNIALKKELNKANEWHYVKEELPELYKDVLVVFPRGDCDVKRLTNHNEWVGRGSWCSLTDVIAWKEIELPKELENDQKD